MATKKASKVTPTIFTGSNKNPNTYKVEPGKIGDIYVDTDLLTLYFCKSLTGSYKWGTSGTS